jgi:ATP-dependent RNA helicase RhlE
MAGDRARSAVRATPEAEPKPVGELKRRPRRRRPSNGGKGHSAQG